MGASAVRADRVQQRFEGPGWDGRNNRNSGAGVPEVQAGKGREVFQRRLHKNRHASPQKHEGLLPGRIPKLRSVLPGSFSSELERNNNEFAEDVAAKVPRPGKILHPPLQVFDFHHAAQSPGHPRKKGHGQTDAAVEEPADPDSAAELGHVEEQIFYAQDAPTRVQVVPVVERAY